MKNNNNFLFNKRKGELNRGVTVGTKPAVKFKFNIDKEEPTLMGSSDIDNIQDAGTHTFLMT